MTRQQVSERGEAGAGIDLDCSWAVSTLLYGIPTRKVGGMVQEKCLKVYVVHLLPWGKEMEYSNLSRSLFLLFPMALCIFCTEVIFLYIFIYVYTFISCFWMKWKDGLSRVLQALPLPRSLLSELGNGTQSRLIASAGSAGLRGAARALREREKDAKS